MRWIGYFRGRVSAELDTQDRFRLVLATFWMTALSVAVVHLFMPGPKEMGAIVLHAVVLGITYGLCVFGVSAALVLLMRRMNLEELLVWHLWALSFAAFNLGYFVVPMGESRFLELHDDIAASRAWLHYLRLLPIWALITHILVLAYTKNALRDEIEQLREAIAKRSLDGEDVSGSRIQLSFGKTSLNLEADRVSHITVEDHYCYLHYTDGDGWKRVEVGLPLKRLLPHLPPSFELVHRSHVVNPIHIRRIDQEERAYRLTLDNDTVIPISRHRLKEVLPRMKAYLAGR